MKTGVFASAICLAASFLVSTPALADKPAWAGGGKHGNAAGQKEERDEPRRDDRDERRVSVSFDDQSRRIIGDYYGGRAAAGKCPPGLAKKHNGCLPPGQAKKWAMGHPLPADLRYYDLPRELVVRLPPPPPRHRYVQIAGDILLIAIGTGMVVDAVEDILR